MPDERAAAEPVVARAVAVAVPVAVVVLVRRGRGRASCSRLVGVLVVVPGHGTGGDRLPGGAGRGHAPVAQRVPEQDGTDDHHEQAADHPERAQHLLARHAAGHGQDQTEHQHADGVGERHGGAHEDGVAAAATAPGEVGRHDRLAVTGEHRVAGPQQACEQDGEQPDHRGELARADVALEPGVAGGDQPAQRVARRLRAARRRTRPRAGRRGSRARRQLHGPDVERVQEQVVGVGAQLVADAGGGHGGVEQRDPVPGRGDLAPADPVGAVGLREVDDRGAREVGRRRHLADQPEGVQGGRARHHLLGGRARRRGAGRPRRPTGRSRPAPRRSARRRRRRAPARRAPRRRRGRWTAGPAGSGSPRCPRRW